jgi:hypothetical protein
MFFRVNPEPEHRHDSRTFVEPFTYGFQFVESASPACVSFVIGPLGVRARLHLSCLDNLVLRQGAASAVPSPPFNKSGFSR